jgi:hypothetical protein
MPIPNTWDKNVSNLTGIFPNALAVGGKIAVGETLEEGDAGNTGVFIPFVDLTGIDNVDSNEIGNSDDTAAAIPTVAAGGSRFMLAVLEAAFAAQQNAVPANRLTNCVVTRSALSVVDEDTLQKTFTVKFKLSHTSQEIEAE